MLLLCLENKIQNLLNNLLGISIFYYYYFDLLVELYLIYLYNLNHVLVFQTLVLIGHTLILLTRLLSYLSYI